jgi:hypothetical protein
MVKEARDFDIILEALRKERNGAATRPIDNLTPEDIAGLTAIGYEPPQSSKAEVDAEIARVEEGITSVESFLNQLIELERQLGIVPISVFQ